MNFKILFVLLFVSACGVKGDPKPPQGSHVPSVMDNYPDVKLDESLKDAKKQ